MAGPLSPVQTPARSLDLGSVVLIGVVGVALVAGFVVLAALGRDTSSYAIFLGGPAVSGVLGVVLSRRVSTVAAAVDATQAQTAVVVAESVSGIDSHLAAQDATLGEIHAGVVGDPVPPSPSGRSVPAARDATDQSAPVSLFGPLRGGR